MAITISGSGITSANIADGTITTDDILASDVKNLKSGRKNLIINGGFDVWQRGASFSGLSPYSYFADRWQCGISTTCSRSTDTPTDEGFNYSAKLEAGSGGNILRMMLEDSYRLLGSNSFTFSFWIKGSVASTGGMDVGDQQVKSFSITTSWTKITQNFTEISTTAHGGSSNDYFDITSSVAGDFYITGVQLELGSVATDFEHRSYGEELALCQRYYEKFTFNSTWVGLGQAISSTRALTFDFYMSRKRVETGYTISISDVSDFRLTLVTGSTSATSSSIAKVAVNSTQFTFDVTVPSNAGLVAGNAVNLYIADQVNGYIAVDAEL
jgi:hypothetical protein